MNYDIIIIGAGSVGIPTACVLAETGYQVLVIEKQSSIGQGEHKKAIGGIRATHSNLSKVKLCKKSLDVFRNWQDRYGDNIEWSQGGYCFVSYTDHDEQLLRDIVATQQSYGLNIEYLNRDEILENLPGINPDGLLGGSWSPEDGNASPLLSINAFYERARELGVRFKFNEKVIDIKQNGDHITSVQTNKKQYYTSWVVNAAGSHAREIAQLIDHNLPVFPDSHEAGITEPVKPFFSAMIVDIRPQIDRKFGDSKNIYFYQNSHGQIIFCLTPDPPIKGTNINETSNFLPQIAKRMISLMPRLRSLRVRRTWRGLYPMTPDGLPILGPISDIDGYFNLAGMCGQGFMLGPGIAELTGRIITDTYSKEDQRIMTEFSVERDFLTIEQLK